MSLGRDPSLDELADRRRATRRRARRPTARRRRTRSRRRAAATSLGTLTTPGRAADAERLAADRTYDQRRELLARASHRPDDSNSCGPPRSASARRSRRPRGRAVLRGEQRPHRRRGARRRAGAKFRIGGRAERGVDEPTRGLFERRARPGRPALADAARRRRSSSTRCLDVLQRAEWRNDPDLFFQVGQGRHSAGGGRSSTGAVCDCLEKDARLVRSSRPRGPITSGVRAPRGTGPVSVEPAGWLSLWLSCFSELGKASMWKLARGGGLRGNAQPATVGTSLEVAYLIASRR